MSENTNLIWIDLEMTGLDPQKDVILEIATLVTDDQLNIIEEGPELVISQPESALQNMDEWVKNVHTKSGLIEKVQSGGIPLEDAQEETYLFITRHCKKNEGLLCGNSVWQDRAFLVPYMPKIINYLNYRLIDVTTIKELVRRWYPNDSHIQFKKPDNHRAMEDIRESVAELKHYRKYFFV